MHFKDLINIEMGDIVNVHVNIERDNFISKSSILGVYICDAPNYCSSVKILFNGKIQILNKILITRFNL